jgi:hypothetical protein
LGGDAQRGQPERVHALLSLLGKNDSRAHQGRAARNCRREGHRRQSNEPRWSNLVHWGPLHWPPAAETPLCR